MLQRLQKSSLPLTLDVLLKGTLLVALASAAQRAVARAAARALVAREAAESLRVQHPHLTAEKHAMTLAQLAKLGGLVSCHGAFVVS